MENFPHELIGKLITGTQLNELCPDVEFVKTTFDGEIHNGLQYKEGFNTMLEGENFNPDPHCLPGGLYFCAITDHLNWIKYRGKNATSIWDVTIPPQAQVVVMKNKIKADMIVLRNKRNVWLYDDIEKSINCNKVIWNVNFDQDNMTQELYSKLIDLINNKCLKSEMYAADYLLYFNDDKYNAFKTSDTIRSIIDHSPIGFTTVPKELLTKEIIEYVVAKFPHSQVYAESIPHEFFTQEIANSAFMMNFRNISAIPEKFITQKMCKFIVSIMINTVFLTDYFCVEAIKHFPQDMVTQEMCIDMVDAFIKAHEMKYFGKPLKNLNGVLACVPLKYWIPEFYARVESIVTVHPSLISSIPPTILEWSTVETAVSTERNTAQDIPIHLLTSEHIDALFKIDLNIITFLPKDVVTDEMWKNALKIDISLIRFAPPHIKTPDVCDKAVATDRDLVFSTPAGYRDNAFAEDMLKSQGLSPDLAGDLLKGLMEAYESFEQSGD